MTAVDHDLEAMARAAKHPSNVVEALARVAKELPAIGKDGRAAQQQGGYAYRGIEQITREASSLLAKYGIVFAPEVISWERDQITVGNKPWTDDRLTIRYTIYGPGGADDNISLVVPGVGRDNSDKGTNKALTQAFKYALLQVLCISDAKDDADGQTHEADEYQPRDPHVGRVVALRERVRSLGLVEQVKELGLDWPWSEVACAQIEDLIDAFLEGEPA